MPTGTRRSGAPAPEDSEVPKAAIFDMDGTLLDSVDLHALAWHEAMVKFGHNVDFELILAQAAEERVPDLSLRRFRAILDLGQQLRFDPDALVCDPLFEGLRLPNQRL